MGFEAGIQKVLGRQLKLRFLSSMSSLAHSFLFSPPGNLDLKPDLPEILFLVFLTVPFHGLHAPSTLPPWGLRTAVECQGRHGGSGS